MKKLLLFSTLCLGLNGMAQGTIHEFQGTTYNPGDGNDNYNERMYVRGLIETAPDESATGANATWDLSDVVFGLSQTYFNAEPSEDEIAQFPGCNFVSTASDGSIEVGKMFATRVEQGGFTILGNNADMFTLTFSEDSAFIGNFPMTYGYSSDDTVAGTFVYNGPEGTFTGNFSGTLSSEFDAYGDLILTDESGDVTFDANRLTVVMNLTFGTAEFPAAGTILQTSHFYYPGDENWAKIRSVRSQISVPLLNINQDTTVMERSHDVVLSTPSQQLSTVAIYPNPVSDVLHVSSETSVKTLSILSMDGKKIASAEGNSINVSGLSSGMYFVSIDSGTFKTIKKFVRN